MKGGKSKIITGIAGFLIVASALWAVALALAIKPVGGLELDTNAQSSEPAGEEITFVWPSEGAAAIGMNDKIKSDFNGDEVRAMASITKVVTALVVLDKKPINTGEIGEVLTMTDKDVALYQKTKAAGGSNIEVKAGEEINQVDMLKAMMLVSANNIADSLANWAFGSEEEYVAAANDWLAQKGFTDTKAADASGLDPASVSTANELVKLAMLADRSTVLQSVFSTKDARFQGAQIINTNTLLGINGIYGLKTGHTSAAGANLLFVSKYKLGQNEGAIYGVVLGQTDENLFQAAKDLNDSAQSNIGKVVVLAKGSVVGQVTSRWGDKSDIVVANDLMTVNWKDENDALVAVNAGTDLGGMTSVAGGQKVGEATVGFESVDVVTKYTLRAPSFLWRITNPF
ncbi:serine hydrolase [Candidatus Saccharibacteria bacterium]|nr:serine hydrolase [Candidatus Saccharibacteria bacterium]